MGYSYQAQAHHVAAGNWLRIDRGLFRLAEWLPDVHDDLARWTLWSKGRAVVSHESARVTTPIRSIVDVAALSPDEEQLGRAIDEAQRNGILTMRALRARAEAIDAKAALHIERASRIVEAS